MQIDYYKIPADKKRGKREKRETYAYHLANCDAMNEFFQSSDEMHNTDDGFRIFNRVVHEAIGKFVPKRVVGNSTDPRMFTEFSKTVFAPGERPRKGLCLQITKNHKE